MTDNEHNKKYYPIFLKSSGAELSSELFQNYSSPKEGIYESYFYEYLSLQFRKIKGIEVFNRGKIIFHADSEKGFFPDIMLYNENSGKYLCIEIDEPYVYAGDGMGDPIHYVGSDDYKNNQLLRAGYDIIRFAESQVAENPEGCLKEILLKWENLKGRIKKNWFLSARDLDREEQWTEIEAQKMAKTDTRQIHVDDLSSFFSNYVSPLIRIKRMEEHKERLIKQKADEKKRKEIHEKAMAHFFSRFHQLERMVIAKLPTYGTRNFLYRILIKHKDGQSGNYVKKVILEIVRRVSHKSMEKLKSFRIKAEGGYDFPVALPERIDDQFLQELSIEIFKEINNEFKEEFRSLKKIEIELNQLSD